MHTIIFMFILVCLAILSQTGKSSICSSQTGLTKLMSCCMQQTTARAYSAGSMVREGGGYNINTSSINIRIWHSGDAPCDVDVVCSTCNVHVDAFESEVQRSCEGHAVYSTSWSAFVAKFSRRLSDCVRNGIVREHAA